MVLAVPDAQTTQHLHPQQIMQYFQQSNTLNTPAKFILLIGAEGGLSEQEIQLAMARQFVAWQLGERVLRTETAPVTALATLQTLANLVS